MRFTYVGPSIILLAVVVQPLLTSTLVCSSLLLDLMPSVEAVGGLVMLLSFAAKMLLSKLKLLLLMLKLELGVAVALAPVVPCRMLNCC